MRNLLLSSRFSGLPQRSKFIAWPTVSLRFWFAQVKIKRSEIPHIIPGNGRGTQGFTLMEVVVTLGIFALCVGMLGLFPQLMNVSAESALETRAAHIAQAVVQDLVPALDTLPPVSPQSTDPDGHPPSTVPYGKIISKLTREGGELTTVDLRSPGVFTGYYDLEGRPVSETDPNARLIMELEITPETDRVGFCQVEVRVRSMSAAPTVRPHRFFSKIAFPRKEAPST